MPMSTTQRANLGYDSFLSTPVLSHRISFYLLLLLLLLLLFTYLPITQISSTTVFMLIHRDPLEARLHLHHAKTFLINMTFSHALFIYSDIPSEQPVQSFD